MARDNLLLQVGQRIAEIRREAGLTQEQLIEDMGISVQYLQRVEGGKIDVRLSTLGKFADHFGIQLSDLMIPPKKIIRRPGRPSTKG